MKYNVYDEMILQEMSKDPIYHINVFITFPHPDV